VPHRHWKTTTLVAGLRTTGITAPYVLDGALNGEVFRAYVRQILAPTLGPGDVVVMDNLPCHKVAGGSKAAALSCSTCRPTALISTRSTRLSPNSRRCCERAHPRRPLERHWTYPQALQPRRVPKPLQEFGLFNLIGDSSNCRSRPPRIAPAQHGGS
jgi:hypothetical protein